MFCENYDNKIILIFRNENFASVIIGWNIIVMEKILHVFLYIIVWHLKLHAWVLLCENSN